MVDPFEADKIQLATTPPTTDGMVTAAGGGCPQVMINGVIQRLATNWDAAGPGWWTRDGRRWVDQAGAPIQYKRFN